MIVVHVTGTPECKIYFTTDGSKPNHMQPKVAGRETTFRYKGPFTMSSGKRTLKAIAVARYDYYSIAFNRRPVHKQIMLVVDHVIITTTTTI